MKGLDETGLHDALIECYFRDRTRAVVSHHVLIASGNGSGGLSGSASLKAIALAPMA